MEGAIEGLVLTPSVLYYTRHWKYLLNTPIVPLARVAYEEIVVHFAASAAVSTPVNISFTSSKELRVVNAQRKPMIGPTL